MFCTVDLAWKNHFLSFVREECDLKYRHGQGGLFSFSICFNSERLWNSIHRNLMRVVKTITTFTSPKNISLINVPILEAAVASELIDMPCVKALWLFIGNLGQVLCSSPGLSSQVVPGGWSCPINPNQRVADKLCLLFNLNLGVSPYLLWPRAGPWHLCNNSALGSVSCLVSARLPACIATIESHPRLWTHARTVRVIGGSAEFPGTQMPYLWDPRT